MKPLRIGEKLVNCLLIMFSAAFCIIVLYKYVIRRTSPAFSIDIAAVSVTSMNREPIRLSEMAGDSREAYMLFFKLNDCYSCIAKGIEDIQNLSAAGLNAVSIVIHDSLDDIQGFAGTFPKTVFFQLTTASQYMHVRSLIFPVIAKVKNNKVVSYRYVTP